jgi:hypothetical protein
MDNLENAIATAISLRPWNKGKLSGAKPPLRPKHFWSIRTKLQIEGRLRDLALLILRSTASFVAVTSSRSRSRMSLPEDRRRIAQRYDRRRPDVRSDLNTEHTRQAVDDYLKAANKKPGEFLLGSSWT